MKLTKLIYVIFSVSLLLSNNGSVHAKEKDYTIYDKYNYPVQLESEAWKNIDTAEEKREISQIPVQIVNDMSTDALLESILDYPLIGDIFAFGTIEEGINVVSSRFYALKEYLNREDAHKKLYDRFMSVSVYTVEDADINDMIMEAFLSHSKINTNLTADSLEKIETKVKNLSHTTYFKGVSELYSTYDMSGTVKTPNGSSVPILLASYELSQLEINNLNKQMESQYPNIIRKAPASRKYNCHSYAWYSQSTIGNNVWMNDPSAYMSDGSYRRSSNSNGNRIYYPQGNHSGIVTAGKVQSKWGTCGVYLHYYYDCPYSTSGISYWTR